MNLDFKYFLTLSLAAHAAILVAWTAPLPEAGKPGQVLLLDITVKTGQAETRPELAAAGRPRPHAATRPAYSHKPDFTARREIIEQAVEANTESLDDQGTATADQKNLDTGSTASIAASSPLPSQDEADLHLRDSIMQLVTQRLSYPAIARRRGWQGVVTLNLHIESDGLISDLHVNETSGYPALDRAAMKSLQLASIPGAREWLYGRSIDMLVPVEYRLVDS